MRRAYSKTIIRIKDCERLRGHHGPKIYASAGIKIGAKKRLILWKFAYLHNQIRVRRREGTRSHETHVTPFPLPSLDQFYRRPSRQVCKFVRFSVFVHFHEDIWCMNKNYRCWSTKDISLYSYTPNHHNVFQILLSRIHKNLRQIVQILR